MPKSKEHLNSDDDLSESEEKQTKKTVSKKKKAEESEEEEEEDEEEVEEKEVKKRVKTAAKSKESKVEKPAAKKQKTSAAAASDDEENENKAEDGMYMLAKNRHINVSSFKGKVYVNIREYYEDAGGNLKPGKKGISLGADQWENLKKHIAKIDKDLKKA